MRFTASPMVYLACEQSVHTMSSNGYDYRRVANLAFAESFTVDKANKSKTVGKI